MRTCDYSDVLRASAALAGFTMDDVGTPEFQLFRTFHDRRLQIAWEIHRWPDLCPVEQRTFRALYDETGATAYAAGAQVLDPVTQQYYQALQAIPANSAIVTGAGVAAANGTYLQTGPTTYVGPGGYAIYLAAPNSWILATGIGGAGIQLYGNTTLTGTWTGFSIQNPLPTVAQLVAQPPTVNGVENSQYWAVCRTSYTADPFDPTAIYPIGTQVQNPVDQNFYQRIVYTGTADGAWTAANWGLLAVFVRNVNYAQAWMANVIGEFLAAWDKDPQVTTKLVKLPFVLRQDGAEFVQLRNTFNYGWNPASTNFSYVWLLYRMQRPLLTGDVLDLTKSYTSGQQVYYKGASGTGNFWTATTTTNAGDTPDSAPTKWASVQLPYIFRQYLIEGGYADWLASDGQLDKATARESMAVAALEFEADKLQRQQQQVNRFDMRTNY